MPRKTWLTAAGVAGAIVIAGSALVAVAATGPSEPGTTGSTPSTSATSSPSPSSSVTPSRDQPAEGAGSALPAVSADDAVEIARAELGGAGDALALEEVDLEFEDGRQIWDIEFVGDREVEVDSTTGDVVEVDFGDDGDDDRRHDDDSNDDDGDDDSGHGRGGHDDGPNHD